MKTIIYIVNLSNGDKLIGKSRNEINKKIKSWCEKNNEYNLTLNQLDSLIYNRNKNPNQRFISNILSCDLNNLYDEPKVKLCNCENSKPYCEEYINRQKRNEYNKLFNDTLYKNEFDFTKFKMIYKRK